MGLWLYIVPRLTRRRLWSEKLGNLSMVLWNAALIVGILGILTAHTQSREYAEMIWIVDIAVLLVLVLNLANIYMTIHYRVEKKLYVSLWYIIGTVIWFPLLYSIGNVIWNPPTGALTGINDTIFNWFFGHNVLGLWFTTGLLAVI
jgi:cbb3-type cytochrome oxidase subunit 1